MICYFCIICAKHTKVWPIPFPLYKVIHGENYIFGDQTHEGMTFSGTFVPQITLVVTNTSSIEESVQRPDQEFTFKIPPPPDYILLPKDRFPALRKSKQLSVFIVRLFPRKN